jgi:RHS repeat-associated protein
MRLYQTAGGTPGTMRFQYDGVALIAEYNSSNSLQRRYVHGSATDEPIVWYEGSGTSDRRFLHSDERGSVVSVTSGSGTTINTYDEYGIPRSTNTGRFQYTGQTWLPELGMYYYKARIYSPTLGRFLQTDPIGFRGGMNIYDYVLGDPVNFADPFGLRWRRKCVGPSEGPLDCGVFFWSESGEGPPIRSGGAGSIEVPGSNSSNGCVPPPTARFATPEDAGLAAVQAQREAQQAANEGKGDDLERSFGLTGGAEGFGYQLNLTPGTEGEVPLPVTRVGGEHLHTDGGGSTLSRSSDVPVLGHTGDVERILTALRIGRKKVPMSVILSLYLEQIMERYTHGVGKC